MIKKNLEWYNEQLNYTNQSVDWIEIKIQQTMEALDLLEEKLESSFLLEEREDIEDKMHKLYSDHGYLMLQLRQEKANVDSLIRQFVSERHE